jgi:regulation of enolase protein 1 (concanavalin A-like superfamily)
MIDKTLDARFDGAALSPELHWHCEPDHWSIDPAKGVLRISPSANTDFWQRTHYGFEADSGHFLHLRASGDFTLTTKVTSHPRHQYDQAGLMVRVSPACWLKTSVEFEPEEPNRLGAVVTNAQYSDWSTQPLAKDIDTVWFRVQVTGADCIVTSSLDGLAWQQIRVAHLMERTGAPCVSCGLYACSPKAAGYQAEFHFLRFDPARA